MSAARGEFDLAVEAYEHALREHEGLPTPFERGRTLLALGTLHARAQDEQAARASIEAALAIFVEFGARLWEDKARCELAEGGRLGRRGAASATRA